MMSLKLLVTLIDVIKAIITMHNGPSNVSSFVTFLHPLSCFPPIPHKRTCLYDTSRMNFMNPNCHHFLFKFIIDPSYSSF